MRVRGDLGFLFYYMRVHGAVGGTLSHSASRLSRKRNRRIGM